MFGRFMSSRPKALPNDENLGCRTVDLLTSTIKIDAEQIDLRFCFRIISPLKTYTLQAVNGSDRTDWVDKITGVIASLLNASVPMEHGLGAKSSVIDSLPNDASSDGNITLQDHKVARVLREVPGNNVCAECGAPEPDWASLNLGVLLCIECSGVHRNLGVHISKVRSLKLDVKVWDPIVVDLFQHLGNKFCNSIWEGLLQIDKKRENEMDINLPLVMKPVPSDALLKKEMYIQSKYVERCLIKKEDDFASRSIALLIWNAVESKNIQELYSLLVVSEASANTIYDQAYVNDLFHPANTKLNSYHEKKTHDPSLCQSLEDSDGERVCQQGCSLLHLSCHVGELATAELLLQFGADINAQDFHGRTPLHHCILTKNNQFAKYLMRRGANPSIKDAGGQSALERTMELGAITDEELLILLTND